MTKKEYLKIKKNLSRRIKINKKIIQFIKSVKVNNTVLEYHLYDIDRCRYIIKDINNLYQLRRSNKC